MYVHTLYIIYLLYTRTDAEYDVGILYGGMRDIRQTFGPF